MNKFSKRIFANTLVSVYVCVLCMHCIWFRVAVVEANGASIFIWIVALNSIDSIIKTNKTWILKFSSWVSKMTAFEIYQIELCFLRRQNWQRSQMHKVYQVLSKMLKQHVCSFCPRKQSIVCVFFPDRFVSFDIWIWIWIWLYIWIKSCGISFSFGLVRFSSVRFCFLLTNKFVLLKFLYGHSFQHAKKYTHMQTIVQTRERKKKDNMVE